MEPMTMMAVATAASAIGQYLSSESARGAAAEETAKLKRLLSKMSMPDFDFSEIEPEEYRVVKQYVPETAALIEERNPTLIQETGAMREGRDAQMAALRRMAGIASQSNDPALMATVNQYAQKSQMEAQSRQASAVQDAQRRGVFGSTMSQVMGDQAAAQAMNQGAMLSQNAAAEAYKNRLNAMMQGAELGGNIRNQDINLQSRNADIINAFNARARNAAQDWMNQGVDIRNQANRFNTGMENEVYNKNVAARNQSAIRNQDNFNDLTARQYEAELGKLGKQFQFGQSGIDRIYQDAADRNQLINTAGNIGVMYAQSSADEETARKNREAEAEQRKLDREAYTNIFR